MLLLFSLERSNLMALVSSMSNLTIRSRRKTTSFVYAYVLFELASHHTHGCCTHHSAPYRSCFHPTFYHGRKSRTPILRGRYYVTKAATVASKWEFTETSTDTSSDQHQQQRDAKNNNFIQNILVCGDGDLSYSAEIAHELSDMGIKLYATVLEGEDDHNKVYQYSKSNTDIIDSCNQKTMFGVDATSLSTYFDKMHFDRIQFNFPHWKGKANNRYNRQLLNNFFESAANVLSSRGEIHVALCDGQGGCSATSLQEWKGSWTASLFAAQHGLLLTSTFPYEATYNLSSHRGVDRAFKLGSNPKMHVFVKPDGIVKAPRNIQLCCRHELHVVIPDEYDGTSTICSLDQILTGDSIESIIQGSCVPSGIRVEVPARQILEIHESHGTSRIAVFLVVYCSERYPVTRQMADQWREAAESEVSKYIPLRENRRGRTVSHPFPYPALHPEIKYHTTGEKTNNDDATGYR